MLMKNIVNRALVAKKKQFLSKAVPRGTRTIWRYLGALFILFTFAGNVWADVTVQVGNVDAVTDKDSVYAAGYLSDDITARHLYVKSNGTYTSTDIQNTTGVAVLYGNTSTTSAKMSSTSNLGPKLVSGGKTHLQVGVEEGDSVTVYWFHSSTMSNKKMIVSKQDPNNAANGVQVATVRIDLATSKRTGCSGWKSTINETAYFSFDNTLYVYAIKVTPKPSCLAPATALSLSSDAPATIYAGTEITFSTNGGNGGDITIEGAASETISANKWTATEGEHTFTASQAKNGNYCAQEAELKLTVLAATPVSTVTVNGPANGYKNNEVIFAATAANATQYRWTVDGVAQGSDSAKLHFTPTAAKTYSIVCEAKNAFNSDWIASTAHSLTVTSLYGDLIHFTAKTSGSSINEDLPAANIGGIVGGTVHQKSQKNGKLNTGHYYSLTLASGSFQVGDTVRIVVTPEGDNHNVPATMMLSSKQDNTDPIGSVSGLSASSASDIVADIILTKGASTIFLSRDGTVSSQNPIVVSMAVIRPMAAKSVAYDLTAVKINGTAISAAELATLKTADAYVVDLMAGYAAAPVVKFARQTTTTYEDDSQKVANDTITVTASEVSGKWQAQATIGTITYTVKAAKQSSAKVYYYDGETKIGEETVAIGGHPAEYAAKQSKNLATFVGWYSDADLADGHLISDIAAEVISADKTVYGKWTYTYAQSVNIEKWVLDNTKTPNSDKTGALISLLGTRGFASNLAYVEKNLELDSLNDGKGTGRNYAYLGLKVKVAGKMLDFRLAKDNTVKVKFGNVGATPLLAINGGEYANMTIEDGVFAYTATGEDYISIKTATDAAVVFQQIMIGENIQDVTLPEPTRHAVVLSEAGETEHGTLAVASPEEYNWLAEGAAVTLSVAVDDGYYIESVTLNGEALTPSENVYSFAMPNATANVVATFAEIVPNNVTYKANNGGEDADILEENATEIAGCSFTYAGHKFNGWNTEANGSGDAYAEGDPVLSPLTLYAQWKEYFVITYKDGDDVLDTEDVFVGEAPVGIADPVKAMNIFQGWTLAGSDEVIDVKDLTASTTVYAKWEVIDACFYYLPTKPAEAVTFEVDDLVPGANGGSIKVLGNTMKNTQYGLSFESSGTAAVLVTLSRNMEAGTVIKSKIVVNPNSDKARGLLLRNAANSATVQEWTFVPAQNPDTLEFTYTVQAGDGLAGTNQFSIKRSTNAWLISLMVSNCAPEQFTVTYKDGEATLGTEGVYENEHPTADGINTHKKGYEFQGWAETVDGAVVDLNDITITAAKNLFAQYTVKDCSPMGVKFSMEIDGSKITSDGYYPNTTPAVGDLAVYATVSGGLAQAVNTSTGTTKRFEVHAATETVDPYFKLASSTESHVRILLDCPLAANDTIKFAKDQKIGISFDSLRNDLVHVAKNDAYYIVPSGYAGRDSIHLWYDGSSVSFTKVEVIRPEIYAVSFNLMGHGSAIAPVNVVKGAKITAPTAPTDEDFAFAGWYKENTLSNAWDFDNDVVDANTTLYAKWLDKSDATLKSLKYGAEEITLQAGVYIYNVELPALMTAVPALTAETSNPSATKVIANADAFDAEGHAISTVVVTPEKEGAATQTYIVNFAKAAALPQVNVTGSTTWNFSAGGSTTLTNQTDVVLANVPGINNDANFNSQALLGSFNKLEGTYFQGSKLSFTTEVPGKLTITFRGTNNNARHLQVCVGDGETVVADWNYQGSGESAQQEKTVFVPAGKVTLKAFEGETAQNARIYNMIFNATPDYEREVSNNIGTLCVEKNVPAGQYFGATFYQIAGRNATYPDKIDFDEVAPSEELKAGEPYIFQSTTGKIDLFYAEGAAVTEPVVVNGMHGVLVAGHLDITEDNMMDVYYISENKLRDCSNLLVDGLNLVANRAYIVMSEVDAVTSAPAPGRRRISIGGANVPAVTTGVDALNAAEAPVKVMIDGNIYILRGEKMYDATGRLVK